MGNNHATKGNHFRKHLDLISCVLLKMAVGVSAVRRVCIPRRPRNLCSTASSSSLTGARITPFLLFLLLLLQCCQCTVDDAYESYMYSIETTGAQAFEDAQLFGKWKKSSVSDVDDSPVDVVLLDFDFPWYGTTAESITISPNGGLHFDRFAPCCIGSSCLFSFTTSDQECNLDTSYFDMIAVSVTDLNPGEQGTIYYKQDNDEMITVFWRAVTFYFTEGYSGIGTSSGYRQTFAATLHDNGKITTYYVKIKEPADVPGWGSPTGLESSERTWLVGLRPPFYDENDLLNYTIVKKDRFDTDIKGVYPPRTEVDNDEIITYYPFAQRACLSPRVASTTNTTSFAVVLREFTGGRETLHDYQVNCSYTAYAYADHTTDLESGNVPGSVTYMGEFPVVLCDIPKLADPNWSSTHPELNVVVSLELDDVPLELSMDTTYMSFVINDSGGAGGAYEPPLSERLCEDCLEWIVRMNDFPKDSSFQDANVTELEPYAAPLCVRMCDDRWNSTAYEDDCGICSSGSTSHVANTDQDCEGLCFGPFQARTNGDGCVCRGYDCLFNTSTALGVNPEPGARQYVLSVTADATSAPLDQTNAEEIDVKSDGDDFYELPAVTLPFDFKLNRDVFRVVYVNPNGALHFDEVSRRCGQRGYESVFDPDTNCNNPHVFVAGLLEHTYYAGFNSAKIWYQASEDAAIFQWTNVVSNATEGKLTFALTLHANGSIEAGYYDAAPADLPTRNRVVLAGIVNEYASLSFLPYSYGTQLFNSTSGEGFQVLSNTTTISSSQTWFGRDFIDTYPSALNDAKGPAFHVFPQRNDVADGNKIHYCPFPTALCVAPQMGPTSGGTRLLVVHNARYDSNEPCVQTHADKFSVTCNFGGIGGNRSVPAYYNITERGWQCVTPRATVLNESSAVVLTLAVNGVPVPAAAKLVFSYFTAADHDNFTETKGSSTWLNTFCDACAMFDPHVCYTDCNDEWQGGAVLDDCGDCATSEAEFNAGMDCAGFCDGYFAEQGGSSQCVCKKTRSVCLGGAVGSQSSKRNYRNYFSVVAPGTAYDTILQEEEKEGQKRWELAAVGEFVDANFSSAFWADPETKESILLSSLARVDLPFTWWFYTIPFRQVYISRHGALLVTTTPNFCLKSGMSAFFSGRSSCEFNVVAGLLSEFEFASDTHIRYAFVDKSSLRVRFTNLALTFDESVATNDAARDLRYSFEMILEANTSAVVVRYTSIPADVVAVSGWKKSTNAVRNVFVGVRQAWGSVFEARELVALDVVNGGRLNDSMIEDKTTLYMFPVDPYVCAFPLVGFHDGGEDVYVFGSQFASLIAFDLLEWTCAFGNTEVEAVWDANANGFHCEAPGSTIASSHGVLLTLLANGFPMHSNKLVYMYNDGDALSNRGSVCQECGLFASRAFCPVDCFGAYFGSGVLDHCGECSGPQTVNGTEAVANRSLDCAGICFGPFRPFTQYLLEEFDVSQADDKDNCGCDVSDDVKCALHDTQPGPIGVLKTLDALFVLQMIFLLVGTSLIATMTIVSGVPVLRKKLRRYRCVCVCCPKRPNNNINNNNNQVDQYGVHPSQREEASEESSD